VRAVLKKRNCNSLAALACVVVTWLPAGSVQATDPSHLYVTWSGLEPDKAASAWYIKRYVDPQAIFEIRPQGFLFDAGIPFDTPQGRYRRTQSASTLESLLHDHPSADPAIIKLGQLVHDIEVNSWQAKRFPESAVIESRVRQLNGVAGSETAAIECLIELFDGVYTWLKSQQSDPVLLAQPARCGERTGSVVR
jgi:hypothetical protein